MNARKRKVRNTFAALAVITGVHAGIAGANVPQSGMTGEWNVSELAFASERPAPISFLDPSQLTASTVTLAGAFDPSKYSPSLLKSCLPNLDRRCVYPEIGMWSSPIDWSLRLNLPRTSPGVYLSARRETKNLLESEYGIDAHSADSPVNARADGLSLGKLEVYAGEAL